MNSMFSIFLIFSLSKLLYNPNFISNAYISSTFVSRYIPIDFASYRSKIQKTVFFLLFFRENIRLFINPFIIWFPGLYIFLLSRCQYSVFLSKDISNTENVNVLKYPNMLDSIMTLKLTVAIPSINDGRRIIRIKIKKYRNISSNKISILKDLKDVTFDKS